MFAAAVGEPASLPRYPRLDGPEPAELRARAYLHSNCGNCHREGGGTPAKIDLVFGRPLGAMGICGVDPNIGDLDVPGAKLLAPGSPATSIVALRMRAADKARMPPLARSVVDNDGVRVVEEWISSFAACP
jgi:hypothetical protein